MQKIPNYLLLSLFFTLMFTNFSNAMKVEPVSSPQLQKTLTTAINTGTRDDVEKAIKNGAHFNLKSRFNEAFKVDTTPLLIAITSQNPHAEEILDYLMTLQINLPYVGDCLDRLIKTAENHSAIASIKVILTRICMALCDNDEPRLNKSRENFHTSLGIWHNEIETKKLNVKKQTTKDRLTIIERFLIHTLFCVDMKIRCGKSEMFNEAFNKPEFLGKTPLHTMIEMNNHVGVALIKQYHPEIEVQTELATFNALLAADREAFYLNESKQRATIEVFTQQERDLYEGFKRLYVSSSKQSLAAKQERQRLASENIDLQVGKEQSIDCLKKLILKHNAQIEDQKRQLKELIAASTTSAEAHQALLVYQQKLLDLIEDEKQAALKKQVVIDQLQKSIPRPSDLTDTATQFLEEEIDPTEQEAPFQESSAAEQVFHQTIIGALKAAAIGMQCPVLYAAIIFKMPASIINDLLSTRSHNPYTPKTGPFEEYNGYNAFHWAVINGNLTALETLLLDPITQSPRNYGRRPVDTGTCGGYTLLQGAESYARESQNPTTLHILNLVKYYTQVTI